MTVDSDREALYQLWSRHGSSFESDSSEGYELADAILDSDWLRGRITSARAVAWDLGYAAGSDDEAFDSRGLPSDPDAADHPHANPYHV